MPVRDSIESTPAWGAEMRELVAVAVFASAMITITPSEGTAGCVGAACMPPPAHAAVGLGLLPGSDLEC